MKKILSLFGISLLLLVAFSELHFSGESQQKLGLTFVSQSSARGGGRPNIPGKCKLHPGSHVTQPAQNSSNGCDRGIYENNSDSSSKWNWSCRGINGGTVDTCSADRTDLNNPNPNNCTVSGESVHQTQYRTTCSSMSNSLPYCSDENWTEGSSGDCITRFEDSRATIPLSPVRYQDVWVSGRLQDLMGRGSKSTSQWKTAHKTLCENAGYQVSPNTLNICKSGENSSGTGDYRKWDSDSGRCYNNGQKEDDDGSDKDTAWLCQRAITQETVDQCESYKVSYNCPAAQICTPNEVDTVSPSPSCGTGYAGTITRTNTCNSDGTAWLGWQDDRSNCVSQICTPNEVDTVSPSPSCGTGYAGTITRTNTCNSDGTAWFGWQDDTSNCVANTCTANEVEEEEISCGSGYVGDQSRTRSCNSSGSSWSRWSEYDRSSCTAISCTANEVEEERQACGTGYTGEETRTNTCNSNGTAYLGWTSWNRSACVQENQDPYGLSVGYTPGKTSAARTITVRAQDDTNSTGLLSRMILQENRNGEQTSTAYGDVDVWNEVTNWNNLNTASQVTRTWTRSFDDGATYKYRLLAYDQQNTLSTRANNNIIEFEADVIVVTPPSISSSTHTDGVESDNDSPRFNITNNHGAGTNQYCLDEYDTCIPDASSTGDAPNFAALPDGGFFFRARTCEGTNCSDIENFTLNINTSGLPSSCASGLYWNGNANRGSHNTTSQNFLSSSNDYLTASEFNAFNITPRNYGSRTYFQGNSYFTFPENLSDVELTVTATYSNPSHGGLTSPTSTTFILQDGEVISDTYSNPSSPTIGNNNFNNFRHPTGDLDGPMIVTNSSIYMPTFDNTPTLTSLSITCSEIFVVCTADEVEEEEVSCGSGYVGDQSRTRSCNSDGTAWSDWTEYDTSACTPVSCTPGSTDSESVSCDSGFTGNQSRDRTCNASGTGYGDWTSWNTSSCVPADASAPIGTVSYTPPGPNWTTDAVRVDIDCSDDTGCDMYDISGWSISGNRYSRTFASNNAGSITLRDNNTTTAYTSVNCQSGEIGSYAPGTTVNPDFSSCEPTTYSSSSAITCGYQAGVGTDGTETFQSDCSNPSSSGRTSDSISISGGTTAPGMGANGCRGVNGGMYPYYTQVTSLPSTYRSYSCNKTYYGVPDPANTGSSPNTTNVPYDVDYIDTSTPLAPTITSTTHTDDVWSQDNDAIVNVDMDEPEPDESPRTNRYCMDTNATADCIPGSLASPNTTNLADGIYYYRVRTCTAAGRCGPISEFIIKIDTTPPTAASLSIVPGTTGPLLANDNQNFQLRASENGGSPINQIVGSFENWNSTNSQLTSWLDSANDLDGTLTQRDLLNVNMSIQNIDNDNINGARAYTMRIVRICDAAGNCNEDLDADGIRTFTYNVYANTSALAMRQVTTNGLGNSSNVADGIDQALIVTLQDVYGNDIVPAPGINRTISFDFNANNNVYLNQYNRTGGSSIFTNGSAWQIGNNIDRSFLTQSSTDGTYTFNFRAYTPTYDSNATDGRQLSDGSFSINNVQGDITGSIGARSNIDILNSNITASFAPLYTTDFGGELANNGFIEGAPQSSNVDVSRGVSSQTPFSKNIYFIYGGETDRLRLDISRSGDPDTTVSENNLSTLLVGDFEENDYGFNSLLTQEGGTIDDISETFLSSHITYSLDGYSVTYNSDVIGKDNYHDTDIDNNTNQSGIKVTGVSSSQDANALTDDQFTDDLSILGKITKSTSRKDIQSSVFTVIKNITPDNGSRDITHLRGDRWSSANEGKIIYNDSVLYFGELAGANVDLGNGSLETVEGKKTIVVEGGNLYIRSNMQYGSSDDILGIVVLQDEDGNGGNLYINPSVTEINATIYVDKSVISYDGSDELDGNTPASGLADQLYIYGSLFSENTIGGSRANPIVCPYYVSASNCGTSVQAQTYDLNYLRRYFVDADRNRSGNRATKFSDEDRYFEYPVVVEYNSRIQSTPPPLFD